MVFDRFNPDMLRLARDVRGTTQAELALSTSVTQALISKIENGLISNPSDDVVARFSAALRFPKAFFYQTERLVGLPHFHSRERSKLSVRDLATVTATVNIRRQHVAKLVRSYEGEVQKPIPQIDLDETGLTPERAADRLRSYWMIPRGPVADVTDIIEQAGGIVVLCKFPSSLLQAVSFRSEGLPPLFCVKRDVPGDIYRLSLASELGHIVMHTIPDDDERMADEALRFAHAFLMPAVDIRPYFSDVKLSLLGKLKAYWKVSIKSLIQRAHDLKLVTDHQFKSLHAQYNKAYREGEPIAIAREEPWKLRSIAQFHIQNLGYSVADLASLLCIHEDDVMVAYTGRPRLELVASR
jgi:Zn-dependent peptidase ImmA (M78 family)/transcriptional regulator with XRE-family HTH domain